MQRSQSFSEIQSLNNQVKFEDFVQQSPNQIENRIKESQFIFQQSFVNQTQVCHTPLEKYKNSSLGNTVIKQGVFQIKINTGSYKKSTLQLTIEKLVILEDKQWNLVFNLKYLAFNLIQCNKNSLRLIKIEFCKLNKVIFLKFNDEIEGKLWFQCLKMIDEKFRYNYRKLIVKDMYFGANFVTENEFLDWAETGDILLFETDHYLAKLQRAITSSNFDHVGLIIRKQEYKEIIVVDVKNNIGVDFEFWKFFIQKNTHFKKICYRKLLNIERGYIDQRIQEFIDKVYGQEFQLNIMKLLQQQSDGLINKGYFCSELIAKAYKYCQLLPQQKASSQYWPVTFSKQLNLLNKAELSQPMMILLDNDINYQL
ncbi:unnamed protein product [Paramecium octaurelia]|uniref:PH domain-containing protein n=1 Tax=Paramecium octaurelia TaxID=43137 RepID=A0A8S1V5A1_PAROT|nr:unnamed protein product [Paramecium octaurelia]